MQSTTGLETRINIESASGSVKELRRFGANFYLDFTIDNLPDYDSSETSKAQRYRIKATSGQDERIVSIGVIGDRSIKIAPGRVKSQLGGGPEAPVVEEPQHTSETAPRMFAEIIAARWFLSEPKITEQDWQSNYGTGTQGFRITGAFPRFAGISGDRYETPEAIILVVTKSYPSKIVFYDVEVASGSGETEPVGL